VNDPNWITGPINIDATGRITGGGLQHSTGEPIDAVTGGSLAINASTGTLTGNIVTSAGGTTIMHGKLDAGKGVFAMVGVSGDPWMAIGVKGGGVSPAYQLTVSKSGTGNGTVKSGPAGIGCGTDCVQSYLHGTRVILTATPSAGSTFTGWSGACTGSGTCMVSMTQARSVTAAFGVRP
jgi:hypothetical protein